MALTTAQIDMLVAQARAQGLTVHESEDVREYLLDRAAQMDGATRLDRALQLLEDQERQSAETFMQSLGSIRSDIMTRGAADLLSMSDDEWAALIGESNERT